MASTMTPARSASRLSRRAFDAGEPLGRQRLAGAWLEPGGRTPQTDASGRSASREDALPSGM
jgi:hypothetical protein